MQNCPYNTETMIFNEAEGMYIITEKALINRGINIRGRLARRKAITPEYIINGLLLTVSEMIYGYIHDFTTENQMQDYIIATMPSVRPIIEKALLQQAIYVIRNGDLTLSTDEAKRKLAIDIKAKQTLNTTIKELGTPITYLGV